MRRKHKSPEEASPTVPAVRMSSEAVWRPVHTWLTLSFILAFSLAVGLSAVYQYRDSPFFNLPIIDEEAYAKWAERIAGGDWLGDKVFYQDPLYPYFLALLFLVFGKNYLAVRVVQELLLTASVGLVFWTGRRLWGDKTGLLAAGLLAGYAGLYYFGLMLVKAPLIIFLSALSAALGTLATENPAGRTKWFACGITLGLLTLLRGNFLVVIPLLVIWAAFIFRRENWRRRMTPPLFLSLGVALIIFPVTLRNYLVGRELILTTSQAGPNFYIGNNEAADGRYVTLPFVRANPEWEAHDFKAEAEKQTGRNLTPQEVSDFWFAEAFRWIHAHPERAFRLLLFKARLMIHKHEIPDNHSFYLIRGLFVPVLWLPFLNLGLLWGPAVVGMAIEARRNRRAAYPAFFTLLYVASVVPFFVVDRYRTPVLPGLALFAAAFIRWLSNRSLRQWIQDDFGKIVLAAATVVAFWGLGLLPTSVSRAPMGLEYYLLGNAYLKTGHPNKAIRWYDEALKALPTHPEILKNRSVALSMVSGGDIEAIMSQVRAEKTSAEELMELGRKLEGMEQIKLAVEAYETALQRQPSLFTAYARLGFLYATRPEIKDLEKAITCLKQALALKPEHLDTMNALGNCYFFAGNYEEARHWYLQVLARDPSHPGARANLEKLP